MFFGSLTRFASLALLLLASTTASVSAASTVNVTYTNPITSGNRPDPGVMYDSATGLYVLTHTSPLPDHCRTAFPILTSPDLVQWTAAGAIFPAGSPNHPKWASTNPNAQLCWAPEIHLINGRYVATYSRVNAANGKLSIGLAYSTNGALGPYIDIGAPIVTENDMGFIDSNLFQDPKTNQIYLYWKTDANAVNKPTPIYGQQLIMTPTQNNGVTFAFAPSTTRFELIRNDLPFEMNLTEGPFVTYRKGFYYVYYSYAHFSDGSYGVAVARSTAPVGQPWVKFGSPMLSSSQSVVGPGHCSVVLQQNNVAADKWAIIYHGWIAPNVFTPGAGRSDFVDELTFKNRWPQMASGTGKPSYGQTNTLQILQPNATVTAAVSSAAARQLPRSSLKNKQQNKQQKQNKQQNKQKKH